MLLVEVSSLLLLCVSAAAGQQGITVKPGDEATLQCHCPGNDAVTLLEWTRLDQKSDLYVFFYRNKRLYKDFQLPSFRGRVELRDPEMKDRDVSVILKNVTINDTGTYKCRIVSRKTENGERTTSESSNFVSLTVTDSVHSAPHKLAEEKKDEGDNGGGNEDGRKSQKPVVVYAACGTFTVMLLIIGAVLIRKLINKQTYVQTEKKEKEAGLHVTQTNHMSQCVDQRKYSAV
ncbi:sodium channel subunit beta-3-like isoform X1 [Limanda limanda]|uniref:sodium channel subunit beta-3-like isoform X1 n=1 Tax=Limanda limanda TaxID=27771 RepID=UPI0029C74A71|nr:sodium channel subunit beta-3-like isoform X1 [Limanda limanda]